MRFTIAAAAPAGTVLCVGGVQAQQLDKKTLKLSKDTQAFLKAQLEAHEGKAWKPIEAETDEGVACNTGTGECSVGPPAKLELVKPSAADVKAREKALNEVVLARWAKRCGNACAEKWNELAGRTYNLTAKAN